MTTTQTAPPVAMTTGVAVLAPAAMPDAAIAAIVRDVATRSAAERLWEADDDTLGTLAFASGAQAALTIVRRESVAIADGRHDLAMLLDAPVGDVLRLDVMLKSEEPGAFARADAALVMLADRCAAEFGAVVLDDLGSVYDPAELARLAAASLPRSLAFSYQLGAARRAAASAALDLTPPPLPADTSGREAPAEPLPDLVSERRVEFALGGPRVPLVPLARMTLALAGDARANPKRLPVMLLGAQIGAIDGLRLAALGVDVRGSAVAAEAVDWSEERPLRAPRNGSENEIDVIARALSLRDAVRAIDDVAPGGLTRIALDAPETPAQPGFPHRIASFGVRDVIVDVYHLDLAEADTIFTTFVRGHGDVAALLGGEAGVVIAIEHYRAANLPGSAEREVEDAAAEAFSTRLARAFVERSGGIAADAAGAIFGEDELAALASSGESRGASWSQWVADAMSVATS